MIELQNGEIYYEDQTQEYKDDLKNKRCIACKYHTIHASQHPCNTCNINLKTRFVASKIKEA